MMSQESTIQNSSLKLSCTLARPSANLRGRGPHGFPREAMCFGQPDSGHTAAWLACWHGGRGEMFEIRKGSIFIGSS